MLKWQITVAWNRKLKPIRVLKTDVHTTICQAKRQLRHQKQICYWFTNKLRMFLFSLFWDPTHPSLWFSYKWGPNLKWDPSIGLGSQLLDWDPSYWTGIPVFGLGSQFLNWDPGLIGISTGIPTRIPLSVGFFRPGSQWDVEIPPGYAYPTGIWLGSRRDPSYFFYGEQSLQLPKCHYKTRFE